MNQVFCALAFLTRLPVPSSAHENFEALRQSPRWYPLVGLLLGFLYSLTAWLLLHILPAAVVAVCVLCLDALATGALHLDGLADMADGFGGGRTREDTLRIMRDHAIGSYGAVALILVLMLKAATLAFLLESVHGLWILLLAPALARWAIVLLAASSPYARQDTAGAGALAASITRTHLWIATVTCAPLPFVFGWPATIACWLAVALVTLLVSRVSRNRIGGVTGDTLGATAVLCETVQFVVWLAFKR